MATPFKPTKEEINRVTSLLDYLSNLKDMGIYSIPEEFKLVEVISNDFSDESYRIHNQLARLLTSCTGITTRYKWSLSGNFIYADDIIIIAYKYINEYS